LELLVRYNGPPAAAADIRDAVLLSCCTTLEEVKDVVEKMDERVLSPVAHTALVRNDLYNWGGGLVEVKTQSGVDRAQLMHQTVLEFATGLKFKSVVIGDLASIISENGHSFHVKHCISMILPALRTRSFAAIARQHHSTEDTFLSSSSSIMRSNSKSPPARASSVFCTSYLVRRYAVSSIQSADSMA